MKFYVVVGFWVDDVETSPGVYRPGIVTRNYYAEVSRNNRRWQDQSRANDELKVENTISILSDLFARKNLASIRYIIWNGNKLKVTNVQLDYPRIKLEVGGFYDRDDAENTIDSP